MSLWVLVKFEPVVHFFETSLGYHLQDCSCLPIMREIAGLCQLIEIRMYHVAIELWICHVGTKTMPSGDMS